MRVSSSKVLQPPADGQNARRGIQILHQQFGQISPAQAGFDLGLREQLRVGVWQPLVEHELRGRDDRVRLLRDGRALGTFVRVQERHVACEAVWEMALRIVMGLRMVAGETVACCKCGTYSRTSGGKISIILSCPLDCAAWRASYLSASDWAEL